MTEPQTHHRPGWLAAGVARLALGTIGIAVPMTLSCGLALAWMPGAIGWLPAALCLPVLGYLWTRPTLARATCRT